MSEATKAKEMDMLNGKLAGKLILFAIPLAFSSILQQLFNSADVAVVGRFAGSNALAAVGSCVALVGIFVNLIVGLAVGPNAALANLIGQNKREKISGMLHTILTFGAVLGIVLMGVGMLTARTVLEASGTPESVMADALLYIRIYFLGIPALALYNFGNAVFSAAGDTGRPLRYLFLSGIVNVILNLFFVIVCKLDVVGVALASALSQCLSAFLIVMALFRSHEDFGLHLAKLRLSKDKAQAILRLGIPSGFQNAIFGIANLFVQLGVNSFSAVMVAGNSAAANADALIYDVMAAFYTACASFMGQNYGSGNKKRVRDSYFVSLAYSFGIGLAMGLLLVVFGKQFLSLFTNDPEVMAAGMKRLTIMGFSYGISAFMDCTIAASRALGKSLAPMVIVILGSCVFRIAWVYTVFAYFQTIPSLYLLYSCSWSLTAIAEILYFGHAYRRAMEKIAETRS